MTKEEMIAELDEVLGKANIKLVEICGAEKPVEEVVVTYDFSEGDKLLVRSGLNEVKSIRLDSIAALKVAKKTIWGVVDKVRDEVIGHEPRHGAPNGRISSFDDVMAAIGKIIQIANERLRDMTKDGFPFMFSEVEMSVEADSAGIYVHSGSTPVCATPRIGSPEGTVREVKAKIFNLVDETRAAIERRSSIRDEAEALQQESEKLSAAAEALRAVGLDTSVLGGGISADAEEAIVKAARQAIRIANKNPILGVVDYHDFKFELKALIGGIVVMTGSKPCLVTRFPKIGNNRTIERTIAFIKEDIAALDASRRAYFRRVSEEAEKEESLREIARRLDSADELLKAARG